MDYGILISRAFLISWRHKYLWVLGLLAGSGGQTCGGANFNPGNIPGVPLRPGRDRLEEFESSGPQLVQQIVEFIAAYWPFLVLGVLLFVAVVFVLWILSLIAQGGLIAAVGRIEAGEQAGLGGAWQLGLHAFWRFLGLWLLALVIVLVTAFVIAAGVVAVIIAAGVSGDRLSTGTIVGLVLLGLLGVLLLIPIAIVVSVIFVYAQRAVAVDGYGPIEALGRGWDVLRSRVGDTLIIWLISVGLYIAAGFIVLLLLAIPGIPLVLVVVGAISSAGFTAGTVLTIVTAVLFFVLAALVISSPINTFFWSYWTLAYLRLTGR